MLTFLVLKERSKTFCNFWRLGASYASIQLSEKRKSTYTKTKEYKGKLNQNFNIPRNVSDKLRSVIQPSIPFDLFLEEKCHPKLKNVLESNKIGEEIRQLSNQELCKLILLEDTSKKSDSQHRVIEIECIRRIPKIAIKDLVDIADALYLSQTNNLKFFRSLCTYLDNEWNNLNLKTKDVISLIFYISNYRSIPISVMAHFEKFTCQNIELLTGNEVGVICHTFFVTNTSFRSYKTIDCVSKKLLHDFHKIDAQHIANILKTLRHAGYNSTAYFGKLGDNLVSSSFINETAYNLTHIVHTFASARIIHEKLFDKILNRIVYLLRNKKDSLRTKDLIKIVWSASSLQHPIQHNLLNSLIDILTNKHNRQMFPEAFVDGVLSLCMNNVVHSKLLNDSLKQCQEITVQNRFLQMNHQYMILNDFCKSLGSEYKGFLIKNEWFSKSAVREAPNLCVELERRQGLASIWCSLHRLLGGSNYVKCEHILQSTKIADIMISMDRKKNFVPILYNPANTRSGININLKSSPRLINPFDVAREIDNRKLASSTKRKSVIEELESFQSNSNKSITNCFHRSYHKEPNSNRMIVIKVFGWNQYLRNSSTILGLHNLEIGILNRFGFDVLILNPKDMMTITSFSEKERDRYCQENILNVLRREL
ncbi:DgyrCDS12127 [Dimorphilus gyrociliatus]|uniref:DgyrCDS12127 n=1 Tax=Dimorphilus gyrociliatus TaxID=2664684 RepID=A0A7I8W5J5_9ANNE|nr:DgyrCDS12127 [Dimorphilus gyrociliatus]